MLNLMLYHVALPARFIRHEYNFSSVSAVVWDQFSFIVLCLTFFVLKFHWFSLNSLTTTSIWSKTIIYSFSWKYGENFKADFLEIPLISQWLELQLPDWSQIKDICIVFHLRPIWILKLKLIGNESNLKKIRFENQTRF